MVDTGGGETRRFFCFCAWTRTASAGELLAELVLLAPAPLLASPPVPLYALPTPFARPDLFVELHRPTARVPITSYLVRLQRCLREGGSAVARQ